MSITISSPLEILNSPLNTSQSKFLFSFPKSSRFGKNNSALCENFYDLPPVRSRRSAGFGYGTKYDFTKGVRATPPPNAYETRKGPGNETAHWSFGLSRDMVSSTKMIQTKAVPGPGAYDISPARMTVSYSLRSRTINPEEYTTATAVPGPGAYSSINGTTKNGKYFFSKYKDSGAGVFNPPRSKRFGLENPQIKAFPGPGTYESKAGTDAKGEYFNSKFHGSMCRSFSQAPRGHGSRPTFISTPGPGSYKMPSEFGHYESKSVKHSSQMSMGTMSRSKVMTAPKPSTANPGPRGARTTAPAPAKVDTAPAEEKNDA